LRQRPTTANPGVAKVVEWIIYRNGPATALDRARKLTSGVLGIVLAKAMAEAEAAGRLSWGGQVFAVKARGPADVPRETKQE